MAATSLSPPPGRGGRFGLRPGRGGGRAGRAALGWTGSAPTGWGSDSRGGASSSRAGGGMVSSQGACSGSEEGAGSLGLLGLDGRNLLGHRRLQLGDRAARPALEPSRRGVTQPDQADLRHGAGCRRA